MKQPFGSAWGAWVAATVVAVIGCGGDPVATMGSTGATGGASGSSSTGMGGGVATASTSTGVCVPVDDLDPCTEDVCTDGVPVHPPKADGTSCDDGDACTQSDACHAGVCAPGSAVVCSASETCVAGACIATCSGVSGLPGPSQPVGKGPTTVLVIDLNGDGKPDVVTANGVGNNVSVILGAGNGTFSAPVNHGAGASPAALAAADLNGDGKPDIVVALHGDAGVSVLLNQGSGAFAAAVLYPAGPGPSSVALADFNGDGKTDIVVADYGPPGFPASSVTVLLNQGNGTFAPPMFQSVASAPLSVVALDLNGDGKPDIAVTNTSLPGLPPPGFPAGVVSVLLNQGNGTFAAAASYPVGTSPTSVAVADMNADGKPDLAVANVASDYLSVLLNQGNGTFADAVNYHGAGKSSYALVAADLNGDGRTDLATANFNSDSVTVFLNVCFP